MSTSEMNYIRRSNGKPLLLIHGLGGSWHSWTSILNSLEVRCCDRSHGNKLDLLAPNSQFLRGRIHLKIALRRVMRAVYLHAYILLGTREPGAENEE